MLLLSLLVACGDEDVDEYVQLNSDEDMLEVQVGLDELLVPLSTELDSNTGSFVIGSASIDPGGGPAQTVHTLTVTITDADLVDRIDKVDVLAQADGRPDRSFELEVDSSDESYFVVEILSFAEPDEQRTDRLWIRVWDLVETSSASSDSGG